MSGIGQGSEDIEHRPETQFLPDSAHIFHGGVIFLRKEEAHACFIQQLTALVRALVNVHAQGFQAVCRTAFAGGCPVAVLGHPHTTCRGHQGRSGGNVEAVGVVSAGTHDLKQIRTRVYRRGLFPHSCSAARDLIRGFRPGALGGQGCQESRVLGRCGLPAHDFIHHGIGFFVAQVFLVDDLNDSFLNHTFPLLLS